MFVLLVIALVASIFAADYAVRRVRLQRLLREASPDVPRGRSAAALPIDHLPEGYLVAEGHTWARFEPTGAVRVGSDLLPIRLLGQPDAVEILPPGTHVRRGTPVATLKRGDRRIALRAPWAGRITEVNAGVLADPTCSGDDPFGAGWLLRLEPSRPTGLVRRLRAAESAKAWMRFELARMREALAALSPAPALVGPTMHDGGVPVGGLGAGLDDERWSYLVDRIFG